MKTQRWKDQKARWPRSGRHILAQYDDDVIWVYQAYNHAIADWALANQAHLTDLDALVTPEEHVLPVTDPTIAARIGLDPTP